MPTLKYINRLRKIDQLIQFEITGSPKELAEKIGVSERQIYRYIDNMLELGAEIKFNKILNSYVYTDNIELCIAFNQKIEKITY